MKASNNKEEEPHFVKRDKFAITAEYKQWFADIKSRLRNSQIKAAIKVNSTLLEFYWSLGRDIVKMKAEQDGEVVFCNSSALICEMSFLV